MAQAQTYDEYGNPLDPNEDPNKETVRPKAGPAPNAQTTPDYTGVTGGSNTAATGSFDRTAFRDQSMARPVGMTAEDFIASNPGISAGVSLVPGSKDKVILPTGEVIDLSINADASGKGTGNGWTDAGQWNGTTAVPYAADAGSGAGMASPAPTTSGGATSVVTPPADDPLRAQLVNTLMQRAGQSLKVDRNDPTIRAQADAYAANTDRAGRDYLRQIAEKVGPYGSTAAETRSVAEKAGQTNGTYEATLMGQELAARRKEISDALTSMQGLLTSDQQLALTKELALIDDATKRLGIQTNADVATAGQGLDWQKALLSNSQFMDQLGLNAEDRYNYWNAVNSGLITA